MRKIIAVVVLLVCSLPVNAKPFYKSKKFWLEFAAAAGSASADYATSNSLFKRGGTEADPIFLSSRPTIQRMFSIGMPLDFAAAYATFKASRSHHRIVRDVAYVPLGYDVGDHLFATFHNVRLCRTSDPCPLPTLEPTAPTTPISGAPIVYPY